MGKYILINKIYETTNFEYELKSIYDFLEVKVFSGSSIIKLTNPSFIRRCRMYHLLIILSLKEYLKIGAYQYYLENKDSYTQMVLDTINIILHTNLGSIYNISGDKINTLKNF